MLFMLHLENPVSFESKNCQGFMCWAEGSGWCSGQRGSLGSSPGAHISEHFGVHWSRLAALAGNVPSVPPDFPWDAVGHAGIRDN